MRSLGCELVRYEISAIILSLALAGSCAAAPLIDEAAQSLIDRGTPVTWITGTQTGAAWQSAIQGPHYQTDRDVGASSVGMAFLAAYDMTGNTNYLKAARAAGDFLIAAEIPAGSGRFPDYYDPPGEDGGAADYGYTSFDDGAAGIADFFWRLYERTPYPKYKTAAIAAMNWLVSQAHPAPDKTCPKQACFFYWSDPPASQDNRIYTGMGVGNAGIAWTFDEFAQRLKTSNPGLSVQYERYALAIAHYLESQMVVANLGGGKTGLMMREQPGSDDFDTGYLSGSAGDAFLFYKLYKSTGTARFRDDADKLFAWVRSMAKTDPDCDGLRWPIETGDDTFATGVEEGNAGIGWVALQAHALLLDSDPATATADLNIARKAGDWLLSSCVAKPQNGGTYWREDEYAGPVHTSLDSGAAGIAIFLYDLHFATDDDRYETGYLNAQAWIESVKQTDATGDYWCDQRRGSTWQYCPEPSWHWGSAGIVDMAARLSQWPLDIPGEQPGL